jgi:hypothetical protein
MLCSGFPKRYWDGCIVREAYAHCQTALEIFELEGQVPEGMATGEPADISTIAGYDWYEWVKFCDTLPIFLFPRSN